MSREIVDAIESGDNIEAESEFSNVMMSKVGNELEAHRQELANEFVNEKLVTELTPDQKKAREMSRGPGGRMHGGSSGRVGKPSREFNTPSRSTGAKEGEKAHRAKRGKMPVGDSRRRVAVQRASGPAFDLRSQ